MYFFYILSKINASCIRFEEQKKVGDKKPVSLHEICSLVDAINYRGVDPMQCSSIGAAIAIAF